MATRGKGAADAGTDAAIERNARGNRIKADGLSASKRARFLEELADTFSVKAAAAAAGAHVSSLRLLRDRDEAFAAAWERALEDGVETMEGMMAAAAMGRPVPAGFNPEMALALVQRWRGRVNAPEHTGNVSRVKRVPIADVEAEILRRLAALKKQRSRARGSK